MIYVTGDTHIPIDIRKLSTRNFPAQKELTKSDFVIICGDFGGVWNNSDEEKYWLKWLENKSFTTLFVDGNHENFYMLNNNYETVDFHNGKAHRINNSIYHLKRGQVFLLDGHLIFTMGGASSHDRKYRIENINWWSDELPSQDEYVEAITNLEKHRNKVDYIISHCAPDSIQFKIDAYYKATKLTEFFDAIKREVKYKKWYFGHYHEDRNIDRKHSCLYNDIVILGE